MANRARESDSESMLLPKVLGGPQDKGCGASLQIAKFHCSFSTWTDHEFGKSTSECESSPLSLWRSCFAGLDKKEWTVAHASSPCTFTSWIFWDSIHIERLEAWLLYCKGTDQGRWSNGSSPFLSLKWDRDGPRKRVCCPLAVCWVPSFNGQQSQGFKWRVNQWNQLTFRICEAKKWWNQLIIERIQTSQIREFVSSVSQLVARFADSIPWSSRKCVIRRGQKVTGNRQSVLPLYTPVQVEKRQASNFGFTCFMLRWIVSIPGSLKGHLAELAKSQFVGLIEGI